MLNSNVSMKLIDKNIVNENIKAFDKEVIIHWAEGGYLDEFKGEQYNQLYQWDYRKRFENFDTNKDCRIYEVERIIAVNILDPSESFSLGVKEYETLNKNGFAENLYCIGHYTDNDAKSKLHSALFRHPYYEVIKAYAEGATIEFKRRGSATPWQQGPIINFNHSFEYRVAKESTEVYVALMFDENTSQYCIATSTKEADISNLPSNWKLVKFLYRECNLKL